MLITKLGRGVRNTLLGMLLAGFAGLTIADDLWPQRTVHLIVPIGVGSAPDVAARVFAERLAARWRQAVVVENRPGAEGLLGATAFAAAPDDHTLLFSPAAPISVFPLTHAKLPYDAAGDFVPISAAIDTFGSIAVCSCLQAASLAELVAIGRARPGELNWASGGGAFSVLVSGFAKTSGVDMVEVPYREQNTAVRDLAEGRIQVLATSLTAVLPLAQAGKIRILAVTNARRSPMLQGVPTALEAGHPELKFEGLIGFFGPRGMTAARRNRIAADIRAVADAALIERLGAAAQLVRTSTPEEFAGEIEEQRAAMAAIVELAGARR
jgi:tripartite-type tricarboxylate transporter receptor subunit TctC